MVSKKGLNPRSLERQISFVSFHEKACQRLEKVVILEVGLRCT